MLHISFGNSKLGKKIWGINLPAIITCRKNAPCAKKCYARKGRFVFPAVQNAHSENLMEYMTDPAAYEAGVTKAAAKREFFRWHSSGDIVDMAYLEMMCRIAEACPNTRFLCFTKQYEIVNEYLDHHTCPKNLVLVFSQWGIFMPYNPHNLPIAAIKFRKGESNIPEGAHHCPKYCGDCVYSGCSCWDLKPGEAVYFDEH